MPEAILKLEENSVARCAVGHVVVGKTGVARNALGDVVVGRTWHSRVQAKAPAKTKLRLAE